MDQSGMVYQAFHQTGVTQSDQDIVTPILIADFSDNRRIIPGTIPARIERSNKRYGTRVGKAIELFMQMGLPKDPWGRRHPW
jgi:hypothetical protein